MDKSNKNGEDLNLTKLEIMLKSPLVRSERELIEILRLLDRIELKCFSDRSSNGENIRVKLCSLKSEDGRQWMAVFTSLDAFKTAAATGQFGNITPKDDPECIGVTNFFEQICRETLKSDKFSGIVVNPNSDSCAVESKYISKYLSDKKLSENSRHVKAAEELMEQERVNLSRLFGELNQIYLAYAAKIKDGKKCDIAVDAKSDSGTYYAVFTTADEFKKMLDAQEISYDEIKGKKNLKAAVEFALERDYDGIAVNPSKQKVVIDRETLKKIVGSNK